MNDATWCSICLSSKVSPPQKGGGSQEDAANQTRKPRRQFVPGFPDLVKRQLREDYRDEDLTEEGLRIFTSFDPILQMKSEAVVWRNLQTVGRAQGFR